MPIKQGIVEYFGVTGSEHTCGYCKGMKPADCDYGMWAHQLKPQEYLMLMERGWRRSGKYCYHPIRSKTCCPPYAIRCVAKDFRLSKSQKKCLKRVNRFLSDGVIPKDKHPASDNNSSSIIPDCDALQVISMSRPDLNLSHDHQGPAADTSPGPRHETLPNACDTSPESPVQKSTTTSSSRKKDSQKAKAIRIAKKVTRVMSRHACTMEAAEQLVRQQHQDKVRKEQLEQQQQQLDQLLKVEPNAKHKMEVRIIRTSFDQDNSETSDGRSKQASFQQGILPIEYAVYSKYQVSIHKDDPDECTKKQYQRFLCETPLMFSAFRHGLSHEEISGYGSYHMQYWIDSEQLIAVAVIDILPIGLSSVYLFYHPDYSFLGLGTYTAIRELDLVRSMSAKMPSFQYYYMGFYIHSCPKMRYKSQFRPSELLCPEVRTWQGIDQAVILLDHSKYSRLEPDGAVTDRESEGISDQMITVVMPGIGVTSFHQYKQLKSFVGHDDDDEEDVANAKAQLLATEKKVKEYANLVGKSAVKSILIYLE